MSLRGPVLTLTARPEVPSYGRSKVLQILCPEHRKPKSLPRAGQRNFLLHV